MDEIEIEELVRGLEGLTLPNERFRHLHASGEARISELHEKFGHRRSTLTSVLDRLEGRGLIGREIDPDDRRAFIVSLTKRGRPLAGAVARVLAAWERSALAHLAAKERALVGDALDAIAAAAGQPA